MKEVIVNMDGSSEDSELRLILQKQNMRRRHLTELPLSNSEYAGQLILKEMNHFLSFDGEMNDNFHELLVLFSSMRMCANA
jgi:hypothetical protein